MWRWLHIPTISISLPIEWLVEFEAEAARIRASGTRRYSQQDVVRQTIKMGLVYQRMLKEQEESKIQENKADFIKTVISDEKNVMYDELARLESDA